MRQEIFRQTLHLLFGSITILILLNYGVLASLLFTALGLFFVAIISFWISQGKKLPFIQLVLEQVERKNEKHFPGKGAITLFIGEILTHIIFFYNPTIILGALIVLVFGDFMSTLAGKLIGKHKLIRNKTLEGSTAGFAVSFIYLSLIFQIPTAFLTAFIGMLAELLPFEDNITIPIISGLVLALLL
ncbi:MAG: hypothetical protein Q7S21_01250 [archaeon]|nr:hypothetical protein [archaeon]